MRKGVIIVVALIIVAVVLWMCRFSLYPFRNKTVVLPNGVAVHVRLASVQCMDRNRIRVKLDFSRIDKKGQPLVVPDMVVTRPLAVQAARFANDYYYSDDVLRSTAYFDLKRSEHTIDIAQTLYNRTRADIVHVEIPLAVHSVGHAGTARVEILDLSNGRKYSRGVWRPVSGNATDDDPPTGAFCVKVKQSDPDGSLMPWTISAPGHLAASIDDEFMWNCESCEAELLDDRKHSSPMIANYVAYRDCIHSETTWHTTPTKELLRQRLIEAISSGHIHITGGSGTTIIEDMPGNGEWIYAFRVKDPSRYSKIRIKYILPPKPKEQVTIRFERV